ncbi:MAG TPA: hypothetical protein VE734_12575, partial [Terriglobales bacterium]|nr:hypothetical protein [Terriglobales bacterium]
VTKAYGAYHRLAHDAFNIARPASFVVDRHGAVRWMYVSSDQRYRADVDLVLQQLSSAGD